MKKQNKEFAFWAPRIILILFALFLVIFSFDVFENASNLGDALIGFFMHNLPSIILLTILIIVWKHDLAGGIIFMAFATACITGVIVALLMLEGWRFNPILIIGSIVFLIVGILFLISWSKKKK